MSSENFTIQVFISYGVNTLSPMCLVMSWHLVVLGHLHSRCWLKIIYIYMCIFSSMFSDNYRLGMRSLFYLGLDVLVFKKVFLVMSRQSATQSSYGGVRAVSGVWDMALRLFGLNILILLGLNICWSCLVSQCILGSRHRWDFHHLSKATGSLLAQL